MQVEALTPQIARQLGIDASLRGVVVTAVDPASAAAESGLQSGDVIREVDHKPVTSVADFQRAVRASKGAVLLLVNRGGNTAFLAIEPR